MTPLTAAELDEIEARDAAQIRRDAALSEWCDVHYRVVTSPSLERPGDAIRLRELDEVTDSIPFEQGEVIALDRRRLLTALRESTARAERAERAVEAVAGELVAALARTAKLVTYPIGHLAWCDEAVHAALGECDCGRDAAIAGSGMSTTKER